MAKHVIFLGAGASWTSGYPLAADLRVILSSPIALRDYIVSKTNDYVLAGKIQKAFTKHENVLQLFREGGFGTVDEFSFLSRNRFKEDIQDLKRFISYIFALHNPEIPYPKPGSAPDGRPATAFEYSDYYPFIQKLFDEDFHELRNDIAILTYNYDPYLEFVLDRAYTRRKQAARGNQLIYDPKIGIKSLYDSTTLFSGLSNRNANGLLEKPGFCFLKLHGTSVLPSFDSPDHQFQIALEHRDVFQDRQELIKKLTKEMPVTVGERLGVDFILSPPIFFPWEIMTKNGDFVSEEEFRFCEGKAASTDARFRGGSFYSVFKAIWQRAQKEIIDAKKISFVGLSMHSFLKSGLKFLFQERIKLRTSANPDYTESELEIVLACPGALHSNADFRKAPAPNSAVAKLISTLNEVNPLIKAYSHSGRLQTPIVGKSGSGGIICYEDFASFIKAEL